ncbi:MAG: phosphoribosylglycinamide synthetase C domain-containing protein, partial [bacterium]|nr:phosphoribosylglycinamide synthetase C domain-containing protein [bacterium]
PKAAATYAKGLGRSVVKADGLASGKGVWVCDTPEKAETASRLCWDMYPERPIVVQEFLEGREVSVFAFTDGYDISPLVAACDYKRLKDGNKGPNTGGMGSYSWPSFWDRDLEAWTELFVMKPAVRMLDYLGFPFCGVLYAGLMLTAEGPKVLEFNARFGDPEAQVILPLLQGDLVEIMQACVAGELRKASVSWRRDLFSVGVVMASAGYPGKHEQGRVVFGLGKDQEDSMVLHGATRQEGERVLTDSTSGRVLTVVGTGGSLAQARKAAYGRVETLGFEGAFWRQDIAS